MLASVARERLRSMCRDVVRSRECAPHPSESTKGRSNLSHGRLHLTLDPHRGAQMLASVTRSQLKSMCRYFVRSRECASPTPENENKV